MGTINDVREAVSKELGFVPRDSINSIVVAAATLSAKRYGNAEWSQDHAQTAALVALLSLTTGSDKDKDAIVVAPYNFTGTDSLYTFANYALGNSAGLMRKAASREADEVSLEKAMSDLDNSDDDDDRDIEDKLGLHAMDRAWYDAEDTLFQKVDGSWISFPELVEDLCEALGNEDYGAVADTLAEFVDSSPTVYATMGKTKEEIAPEVIKVPTVRFRITEDCCPLDSYVEEVVEAKPLSGSVNYDPDDNTPTYDVITEDWRSVTADDWKGWRRSLDIAIKTATTSNSKTERANAVKDVKFLSTHLPEAHYRDDKGDPYNMCEETDPAREIERAQDLVEETARVYKQAGEFLNMRSVDEWIVGLDLNDKSYREVAGAFASAVNAIVMETGLTAKIRRALGVEDFDGFEMEHAKLSDKELRSKIISDVVAGKMFPSQATILLRKLDSVHPNQAKKDGQAVYENSVEAKKLIGQRRISSLAEMILAEKMFGVFEMGLPATLVAVIGSVNGSLLESRLSSLESYGIVDVDGSAAEVADGVKRFSLPIAASANEEAAKAWAEDQAILVSDVVVCGRAHRRLNILRKLAEKLGKPFRTA
jgi:hypothetical protein